MRRIILIIMGFGAGSCLLNGCESHHARQQDWHNRVGRGLSAVESVARQGTSLLVDEQLIEIIELRPDFKVSPLEFCELYAEDDAYRNRAMNDIWTGYCQVKKQRQQLHCVEGPERWQDCEEFKKCGVWVYDESVHFDKPLRSDDWLYCLWCKKPHFFTVFFFVEQQVIGGAYLHHDKPFQTASHGTRQQPK